MKLFSHWMIPAVTGGVAFTEIGASAGATPAHFAAAGMTILGIVLVVKGYDWVDNKVEQKIAKALAVHNLLDQRRFEELKGVIAALHEALNERTSGFSAQRPIGKD